jgi:hypothetical protein
MIREELQRESFNKSKLNEGLLEKLLMTFLSPMIKREVKKIKNDPEIIEAEKAVEYAIDQWKLQLKQSIESNRQAYAEARKAREEYKKSQGKK